MRWLLLAALMLTLPGRTAAADRCLVEVRVDAAPHGAGLGIDGTRCKADLEEFWRVVENKLPRPLPRGLTWFSLMAPAGDDERAAMSAAWRSSCNHTSRQGTAFLDAYKLQPAARVLAPSLARLGPIPESVDNFYVVERSKATIQHPACKRGLLSPVIYFRLSASNGPVSASGR
ncbi:hypothetical protein [Lysobacter sp. OAE881]|uniref:hypothetical protein n=1 Tax=Lysobacter sp. OAE881 TaxID=2663813 RepID=UPI00178B2ED4